MNNGKSFPQNSKPNEWDDAFYFQIAFPQLLSADERLQTRKFKKWLGNFRRSVPNGKRGLPLEVVYNFRSEFPQKFPFHFTFNQNFRIILLNGKRLNFPENLFKNCILPTEVVLFFLFRKEQWKVPHHLLNFHFPVSHLPKTIANGKCHIIGLVSWFWKNFYHYSLVIPYCLFWQTVSTRNFLETRSPNIFLP